jgi:ribosomal protein L37AE/L43A
MSEHDIADCPKCGKRDFVLKEDNTWVCLNCNHNRKMPKSGSDSGFGSDVLSVILAVLTALLLAMAFIGV